MIDTASTTGFTWFKSSYSNGAQNCVETARVTGIVPVRDSKEPNGPALAFSPAAWGDFLTLVKGSDLPTV